MIVVDVGVWLAAAWDRHAHHAISAAWVDRQDADLVLCRVTQTGLLRLLSNPAVMRDDALRRDEAWSVVDEITSDDRVVFATEPSGLDNVFRALSARADSSHQLWTDDYLAAFTQSLGAQFATLDRRIAGRYPSIDVITVT